jgi:hypothetical protein
MVGSAAIGGALLGKTTARAEIHRATDRQLTSGKKALRGEFFLSSDELAERHSSHAMGMSFLKDE